MKQPYEITNAVLSLYGQISEALGICKSLLLVKPEAKLRKQNRIKTIYSSLAIEGNTLDIEQVSALIDDKRIVGSKKEIQEVQNAIQAYDRLDQFKPHSMRDFLKAHSVLMKGLVNNPGKFRHSQVGIKNGIKLTHIAPNYKLIPNLMKDLFDYLQKNRDLEIIKSCVFHYETEFIHPFEDGNGRMGRYWQTRLLMNVNPIFEYVPVEETIKNNQREYYNALAISDRRGSSTIFVEFMLEVINNSLRKMIEEASIPHIDYAKRIEYALPKLNDWFDRKEYMKINKAISTATASRDLKRLLDDKIIEAAGTGRMTKYKKVQAKTKRQN